MGHYGWTMFTMQPSTTPRRTSTTLTRQVPTTRYRSGLRWLLVGGWVLIMPPVPMGTALPPLSEWSKLASYETTKDCETAREAMQQAARKMVTADPNATALQVAAALGRLQARCVQVESPKPPAAPVAPPPAAAPPAAEPATPRRCSVVFENPYARSLSVTEGTALDSEEDRCVSSTGIEKICTCPRITGASAGPGISGS